MCDACIGTVCDNRRDEHVQVSGSAAVIDVQAVGLRTDHDNVRAGAAQRRWRDVVRGPVRTVHHDPKACQRA